MEDFYGLFLSLLHTEHCIACSQSEDSYSPVGRESEHRIQTNDGDCASSEMEGTAQCHSSPCACQAELTLIHSSLALKICTYTLV